MWGLSQEPLALGGWELSLLTYFSPWYLACGLCSKAFEQLRAHLNRVTRGEGFVWGGALGEAHQKARWSGQFTCGRS